MRAVRARLRETNLRAERGGVLVEIMVSAVVMVLVAGATFKSIDAASSVSAGSKTKSVATSIAQKYMDDLRSQDPLKLSSWKTASGSETVDGVTYSYTRTAYWVRDSTQDKSCDGNPGDYLKLGVTVTWTGMTGSDRPVKQYSILTEPNGTYEDEGNLAIIVKNDAGVGQAGIPITLSPGSLTDTTDANGCAYYANINPGAYTGTIQQTGYVDKDGKTSIAGSWTIVAGQTTTANYGYAPAATPTVNFVLGTGSTATTGPYVTFNNAGRTTPLLVGNGTAVSSLTGSNLYPFVSAYSVYAGQSSCTGNNTVYTSQVLPTTNPITVREPPLNINVKKGATTSGATVITDGATKAFATISGCGVTVGRFQLNADGSIPTPQNGWPAGPYTVCVDYSGFGGNVRRLVSGQGTGTNLVNSIDTSSTTNSAAGNSTVSFTFLGSGSTPSNGTSGACP